MVEHTQESTLPYKIVNIVPLQKGQQVEHKGVY